jgi:CO/xanthine dehydrogenase Mo-binding subunit
VLKPVLTPEEAMAPDAPLVHPPKPNKLCQAGINRGNFDEAWKNAAHTVNVKVQTQHIEHAFLEPESCLAIPLTNGAAAARFGNLSKEQQAAALTAVANGRNSSCIPRGRACTTTATRLPTCSVGANKVYVELVSNGGAFGGKEDLAIQPHVALMAWLTKRPCKATFNREESTRFHPKRHPIKFEYWAGCDKDGHLTCVKVRAIGDKGAYASVGTKVLERAGGHACGPYRVPVVDINRSARTRTIRRAARCAGSARTRRRSGSRR